MKKILYLLLIFPGIVLYSTAQECPGTLVHYWKLDRNAQGFVDHVGGLTAQIEVAPLSVLGIVDSAQYFNGLSEISVPDNITFDWDEDESFSIEFWVRKSSLCQGSTSQYNNVIIGRDDPNIGLHWWVGIDCQSPGRLNFTLFSGSGNGTIMKTKKGIIDGNWHHVVAIRDGEQNITSLYLDNELDTSVTYTYAQGFGSIVPVNIGWLNRDSKYHLDASIDELGIHNVALTEEVISDHFNNGNGKSYCSGIGTGTSDHHESLFNVYPTVATSEFHVTFSLENTQTVNITAFDVTGKKVAVLFSKRLTKGTHDLKFSTEKLRKNSMIILQLKLADKLLTRKLVLQ